MISDEKILRLDEIYGGRMCLDCECFTTYTKDELLLIGRAIYEQGRADQREADARLCDLQRSPQMLAEGDWSAEGAAMARECAEAIRNNTGD